jgi:hypothetical protein
MTNAITSKETLYLPLAKPHRAFPWEVFHETHRMGAFATQDECFRHALRLAEGIGRHRGVPVRLKIEGEDGVWDTLELSNGSEKRSAACRQAHR